MMPAYYTATTRDGGVHMAALISLDGKYRYWLSRDWTKPGQQPAKTLLFVMLNPSTATHTADDPTIRKCVGFAKRWGYTAIEVVNLYPFRATDPKELTSKVAAYSSRRTDRDAVDWRTELARNDEYLRNVLKDADTVVCAWGANARHPLIKPRVTEVMQIITDAGHDAWAVNVLHGNVPAHPLMQRYTEAPLPFNVGGNRLAPTQEQR